MGSAVKVKLKNMNLISAAWLKHIMASKNKLKDYNKYIYGLHPSNRGFRHIKNEKMDEKGFRASEI